MIHQLTRRLAEDMADKLDRGAGPHRRQALVRFLCLERPTLEDACEVIAGGIADHEEARILALLPKIEVQTDARWLRVIRRWEAKHRG